MGKLNINNGGVDTNKVMANIDERFGPYASIEAANTALGASGRDCITAGLTVGITQNDGSVKEYWYQPQGSGLDLVPKQRSSGASVEGNFASFDANGELLDSGHKHSDYATSQQGGKADTAYQKPTGGIPITDLESDVQNSLGKADTAVQQFTVGTTTTGEAGTDASVTNRGTQTNPILDFTIPKGEQGDPGQNAVNPFKGWFNSLAELKAAHTATDGDSAYVKDASPATTWSIYVYDSTASSDNYWSDSGTDADTSNVQTFASGEEVNEVHIVNDFTNGGEHDVLSAEQGKIFGKEIYGELYNDTPEVFTTLGNNYININGNWSVNPDGSSAYLEVHPWEKYKIICTSADGGLIALLTDINTTGSAAFSQVTGFTDRIPIYYNNPILITIPNDDNVETLYLYKTTKKISGDIVVTNAYKENIVVGIKNNVIKNTKDIQTLGQDVNRIDITIQGGFLVEGKIDGKTADSIIGEEVSGCDAWQEVSGYFDKNNAFNVVGVGASYVIDLLPYITAGYNRIAIYANDLYDCAYTFTKTKAPFVTTSNISSYLADIMNGVSRVDFSLGDFVEIDLPEGTNARYLYCLKYVRNITSGYFTPKNVFIEKGTVCPGITREENYNELGLHTLPESIGQLNVIKRCRQMTDIEWTPAVDLPKLDIPSLTPPDTINAQFDIYRNTVFKAGVKYKGIPYARCISGDDNFYVGLTIDFGTFITSVCNPESKLCKTSVYDAANHRGIIYAAVCSALVTYALNVPYINTAGIPNISGLNMITGVINNGVPVNLNVLKLGDVLNKSAYHAAVVTDIITNQGSVEYVEICEATPAGNGNTDIQGNIQGGVCRRIAFDVETFYWYFTNYSIYRYEYIDNVPYTKSPYINIGNELDMKAYLHYPVMPYEGNNYKYSEGDVSSVKLLINNNDYQYLRVFKNNTEIANSPFDIRELSEIDITEVGVGDYSAYLCNVSNGSNTAMTGRCKWSVIAS